MSSEKNSFLVNVRITFMRGVVVIVPIVITVAVLKMLFEVVDGIISPLIDQFLGYHIYGLGFFSMLLLIIIVGLMSRNLIGKVIIRGFDKFIASLPLARTIYSAIRDLVSAFAIGAKSKSFRNVVCVEYPRAGIYSIGFATNEISLNLEADKLIETISVYFPHPPNPTSGVLVFVPKNEVHVLNLTIEEGLKLVLSAGVVGSGFIKRR